MYCYRLFAASQDISLDPSLDECWRSRQASPKLLLRGVLREGSRGGGRPRRNQTEDMFVTSYYEESTLSFACWLHYFIETRRGWLVLPKTFDDEESCSLFVLLYDDLSISSISSQPAFGPGGACALDRPVLGASKDTFVRMDFDSSDVAAAAKLMACSPEVCVSVVEQHADSFVIALVFRVTVTSGVAERAVASWAGGVETLAVVAVASWIKAGSVSIDVLGAATNMGRCKAVRVMPSGWDPEMHRVHFQGVGEMAAFIVTEMVASELRIVMCSAGGAGPSRSSRAATSSGCTRAWQGTTFLELFDSRAASAVRRALFETYLIILGADIDFDRRCRELGISQHEYPEASSISRSPLTPKSRPDQLTKNNLTRKIIGMGGTTWSFDTETVIRPLQV